MWTQSGATGLTRVELEPARSTMKVRNEHDGMASLVVSENQNIRELTKCRRGGEGGKWIEKVEANESVRCGP